MCKLCDNILDETKVFIWRVRNKLSEDNLCDFIRDEDCEGCNGCGVQEFRLRFYKVNDTIFVSVEYLHKLTSKDNEEIIIHPFSEGIPLNFCPNCGKQISEKIRDTDSINYYFNIEDKPEK